MKNNLPFLFLLFSFSLAAQVSESDYLLLRESLIQKINQLRVLKELPPLKSNLLLRKAAKNQSVYMAENKKIGHGQSKNELGTPYKRVRFFKGMEFEIVGENVLHSGKTLLPLNNENIEFIAKKMFESWKNSPEHYANMIKAEYEFGDIDFQFEPEEKIFYATQVFGKKGVKIKGQLSNNAFGISDEDEVCYNAYENYENLIANMGNSIHIEGDKVMFYYHDIAYFNEIFSGNKDGIAIDLVFRDQVSCGTPNQIDYSPIYDGILLKPVFKKEILRNNTANSSYRIISQVGTIPDSLQSKTVSCSVVLIKDGSKCKYLIPGNVPSKRYELRAIQPKLINPSHVNLIKNGIIKSQEINYNFKTNITTPIEYPMIEKVDYPIHAVEITSFSSVEGDQNKNSILHEQRAQTIKKHLQSKVGVKHSEVTIAARENWDKMYFQLRYFFADELADLTKDSLKNILASDDESLPWDSLLFNQRKSIATIHYKGIISDTSDYERILEMNLKTAISSKQFDLANKALFEMYKANIFPSELLFEETIFKAILQYPEITQNSTAILSKSYKKNLSRTVEFLFSWLKKKESLSIASKYNLLHLYTLMSTDLMNSWDLPAKRLSNVVHPNRIQSFVNEDLESKLILNLNLTFIRYFGQINDGPNITKSFNYITEYFKSTSLNIKDEIDLALFFNNWSRYDLTNNFLLSKFYKEKLNEDAVFILLKTLNFYTTDDDEIYVYDEVYLKALELNKRRWCYWVNREFQILRNQGIKDLFCSRCGDVINN